MEYKVGERYLINWGGDPCKCKIIEIEGAMIRFRISSAPYVSDWRTELSFSESVKTKLPAKWWDRKIVFTSTKY